MIIMAKVLNGDHGLRGQRLVQWGAGREKEGKHTAETKQVIRPTGALRSLHTVGIQKWRIGRH